MIVRVVVLLMVCQCVRQMHADPPLLPTPAERVYAIDSTHRVGITKVGYQVRPGGPVLFSPEPERVFSLSSFWEQPIRLSLQHEPSELLH